MSSTARQAAPARVSFRPRIAPSVADLVFLIVLGFAAFGFGGLLFNGDADLGRHIRVGNEILRRGLFFRDVLSHTNAGRPFVPYEWASEVVFALTDRAWGLVGVTMLSAVLLGTAFFLLARFLLRRGTPPVLVLACCLAAALVGAWHWAARPHLFTLCAIPLALGILESDRPRPLATVALFCAWANLHGGFLFGLVLVSIYFGGAVLERDVAAARRLGLTLAAAVLGSLVNPTGPSLLPYVLSTLGEHAIINATVETQSPDFHQLAARPFLLAILATLALLGRRGRPMPLRRVLVVCATLAFGLMAQRNMEFFAMAGLPLLVLGAESPRMRLARAFEQGEAWAVPGAWSFAGIVAVLLMLGPGHDRLEAAMRQPQFIPERYPVEAVRRAREAGLDGRMFNDLNWGGYILYAWPEQRVFIDAQSDFYGSAFFEEYGRIVRMDPGWRDALHRYGVTMALIPTKWSRLADAFAHLPGWRVWYRDATATLLVGDGR